jgi:hypothetical protein
MLAFVNIVALKKCWILLGFRNRPTKYICNDVIVGLTVFRAVNPLDILGVLFLEVS